MTDAKPYWTTSVSDVEDSNIFVRGYSLRDVMGRLPFSASTYLLIRGRVPTPAEARMMDVVLCAILDYSLEKPATVAARYCVSSNPQMVPGLATAVLGVGENAIAPENAGRFIAETFAGYRSSGEARDAFAARIVAEIRAGGRRVPGFGHPRFHTVDPRAQRQKEIAQAEGVWGEVCEWYEALHRAFLASVGKKIAINDVGMMAAILTEMGFTPPEMTGLAVISTLPGAVAHISEELNSGIRLRTMGGQEVAYDRTRRDLATDLTAAGW